MKTKRVNSISEVDFSNLVMPCIGIYRFPADYPEHCVARVFCLNKPTNVIMIKRTVKQLKEDIESNTKFVFIPREKYDAPALVGTYI